MGQSSAFGRTAFLKLVSLGAIIATYWVAGCSSTSAPPEGSNVQADTASGLCGNPNIPAVDYDAEIVIRDLRVVEDGRRTQWDGNVSPTDDQEGAWSFGRLFADLARKPDGAGLAHDHCMEDAGCLDSYTPTAPANYVRNWILSNWDDPDQVLINCDSVPIRPNIVSQIIDPWPKAANGDLDLTQSPFRLLAIVRRPDLVDMSPPGTSSNDCTTFIRDPRGAGELRFVFGLTDPVGALPKNFTVILEYNVPANTTDAANAELQRWHTLASSAFGSDDYLSTLATLTREITRDGSRQIWPHDPGEAPCDSDDTVHAGRQHDNNLLRIRTQDRLVDTPTQIPQPSQFRQFEVPLDSNANAVGRFYLTETPAYKYRQTDRLGDFITDNCADIEAEHFKVGQEFPKYDGGGDGGKQCSNPDFANAQFQAGQMPNEQTDAEVWDPGNDSTNVSCNGNDIKMGELRHLFARNTCNGCHGIELEMNAHDDAGAQPFHIAPRAAGQMSEVSRLLQGSYTFVDPLGNMRTLDERKQRVDAYVAGICANQQ